MNREKFIRKSFFNSLSGVIDGPVGKVPIFDDKADSGINIYMLIEGQTAREQGDFVNRRWNSTVTISINHKQDNSYTRDIVDDICESIETIITPGKRSEWVLPGNEWGITNVYLSDVSYADFQISSTQTICVKYLTFNLLITKI
jgi:hypothetical protein